MIDNTNKQDYSKTMFAIAFDLNTDNLKTHYGTSIPNAYSDIRKFLEARGFANQQGSLYYGDTSVTSVSTTLTIVALSQKFPWFQHCVEDIRMLQLLTNDDLKPAVAMGSTTLGNIAMAVVK